MKTTICKLIAIYAISILSMNNIVRSQEFVRELYGKIADTTIVREIDKNHSLAYGYHFPVSAFYMIADGQPAAPMLQLPDDVYIADYEKYGEKIYFCGYRYVNETKTALAGYFDISSFPLCNVYYYVFPSHKVFKKLDIYYIIGSTYENHFVMTGVRANGKGSIADAYLLSSTMMECRYYESFDDHEEIDDVAVSNKYVTVSSRLADTIVLRHFRRPTTLGHIIFSLPNTIRTITSPRACSPVLLKQLELDTIGVFFDQTPYVHYLAFAKSTFFGRILRLEKQDLNALDIKYLPNYKTVELLFGMGKPATREGIMYKVPRTVTGQNTSFITGHRFPNNMIWSMDVTNGNNIISTGYYTPTHTMRIFRHIYDMWESCSEKERLQPYSGAYQGQLDEEFLFGAFDEQTRLTMTVDVGAVFIEDICISNQ